MALDPTPQPARRRALAGDASMASRVGLGIMVLAGLVLGLLIIGVGLVWGLFNLGFQSIDVTAVVVLGLIVALPAVLGLALWRFPWRPLRRLGFGLCTGSGITLVALVAVGVWTGFDPSAMRQGEIDNALAEITSTDREAFYLGDEVDGENLAVIEDQSGVLYFHYGRCLDNAEGACTRPLMVTSQPPNTYGSSGWVHGLPCERLRPVLGVPAASMPGGLTVFTGSSMVSVSYFEVASNGYMPDNPRQASLAPQLRPVGQPTAAKMLPPPDPDTQAFVDQHCGPNPGDKARLP
jgi:hypothetical protein